MVQASATALVAQGNAFFEQGNLDEAIRCYSQAISFDSWNRDAICNRALSHLQNKSYRQAIADFEMALQFHRADPIALCGAGDCFYEQGDFQRALEYYDECIRITPPPSATHVATFYCKMANCLYHSGKLAAAIANYDEAIRSATAAGARPDAVSYHNRGYCFFELNNFTEAIQNFNEAIALEPSDSDFYISRGDCYVKIGEWAKARFDFTRALELDPSNNQEINARLCNVQVLESAAAFKIPLPSARRNSAKTPRSARARALAVEDMDSAGGGSNGSTQRKTPRGTPRTAAAAAAAAAAAMDPLLSSRSRTSEVSHVSSVSDISEEEEEEEEVIASEEEEEEGEEQEEQEDNDEAPEEETTSSVETTATTSTALNLYAKRASLMSKTLSLAFAPPDHQQQVDEALKAIADKSNPIQWAVFGPNYHKEIEFCSKGEDSRDQGYLAELLNTKYQFIVAQLSQDQDQEEDASTNNSKMVFITWIGPKLTAFERARSSGHRMLFIDYCRKFIQFNAEHQAFDKDDLTQEVIMERVFGELALATPKSSSSSSSSKNNDDDDDNNNNNGNSSTIISPKLQPVTRFSKPKRGGATRRAASSHHHHHHQAARQLLEQQEDMDNKASIYNLPENQQQQEHEQQEPQQQEQSKPSVAYKPKGAVSMFGGAAMNMNAILQQRSNLRKSLGNNNNNNLNNK